MNQRTNMANLKDQNSPNGMKEFSEIIKAYKEYVLAIVAIVTGCILVLNYFATKDALAETQKKLNLLIDERECWLNNRITMSEVQASIANLERERLEKIRIKIDLTFKQPAKLTPLDQLYGKEQLEQINKDFLRIDDDLKSYRITAKVASENLFNGSCNKRAEVRK